MNSFLPYTLPDSGSCLLGNNKHPHVGHKDDEKGEKVENEEYKNRVLPSSGLVMCDVQSQTYT